MLETSPSTESLLREDLKRSTHRLFRVGQLFAVVPWNVTPFEPIPKPPSWGAKLVRGVYLAYSIAIILAVCSATVFHHSMDTVEEFFAVQTLCLGEDATLNVIVLLAVIGSRFVRPFYAKFVSTLLLLAQNLSTCGVAFDFKRVETIISRLLVAAAVYFATIGLLEFLINYGAPHRFICQTVLYTLPNVIHVLALYKFVVLHWFIYKYHTSINRVLRSLGSVQRRAGWAARSKFPECAGLVEILRKTHLQLCQLTTQVNDCFGALTVCTMLSSFVVISLQLFNVYKLTTERSWSCGHSLRLAYTVLWIALQSAKVLLILYPLHFVRLERDRTGSVLYSFNHSDATELTNNALMRFSSQVLHGKEYHTACGLITLDLTLITTMIGALTTYLVILIQFDSAFSSRLA
ncbi:putative gustatory receptor 28b [Anopheles nili]|uniref:putative gustatory receptor 28b n=1 Tax=Anopheles nili TaxID=185578 RepID=UPI00237C07F6|nr:putative gustatory receptor 28b [Anopheles nili]